MKLLEIEGEHVPQLATPLNLLVSISDACSKRLLNCLIHRLLMNVVYITYNHQQVHV